MSTLRFLSDWTLQRDGELRGGEPLRIEYDPARLPECRASYRGQDAWSIAGYVRFHPSMELESVALKSGSAEVDVPQDARRVELWFNNTDNTGCVAWDSRYGQNYWLDVAAA
ncbi:MAG: hypothetical protein QOD83_30 [Solirubrobacteraceae bacterium]|nr:hypothetical protein [Solirubrobacteraceae bacterium]